MRQYFTTKDGRQDYIDFDEVRQFCKRGEKIQLIKEYRRVSGYGLKDSKDAIDVAMNNISDEPVVELFRVATGIDQTPDPYTKEEFLHLVEKAIDDMGSLHFTDMLEAVQVTLENVKKHGGLVELAKQRDKFLRQI